MCGRDSHALARRVPPENERVPLAAVPLGNIRRCLTPSSPRYQSSVLNTREAGTPYCSCTRTSIGGDVVGKGPALAKVNSPAPAAYDATIGPRKRNRKQRCGTKSWLLSPLEDEAADGDRMRALRWGLGGSCRTIEPESEKKRETKAIELSWALCPHERLRCRNEAGWSGFSPPFVMRDPPFGHRTAGYVDMACPQTSSTWIAMR